MSQTKAHTPAAVPAFQAERWIGGVVRETLEVLPSVLVVDDGSTDGTVAAAKEAGAEVLSLGRNRGKGAALRAAFTTLFERGFEQVVTLDADGQHLPSEIPKLLAAKTPEVDLVLGSRAHSFSEMGGLRRVSNRASSRIISLLAGVDIPDAQTGFRLYSRRLVQATGFPECRFEAESTVVVRAGRRGFRVVAVPVEVARADGRGSSHYRALVDGVRIGFAVTRARLERAPRKASVV